MKLRIVLAGGGLCNIQVVKLVHDYLLLLHPEEVEVTLISNYEYTYYSAMYPGLLAQQYTEEAIRVELAPLAVACNAKFIVGQIIAISNSQKLIRLADDREIPYDLLSINIGSQTRGKGRIRGLSEYAIMTRPLNIFLQKLEAREQELRGAGESPRIVVVGAGASGVELSLVLHSRFCSKYPDWPTTITIVDRHPQMFSGLTPVYREIVMKNMQAAGVKMVTSGKVRILRDREVELADGRILCCNIVIWATGPERQAVEHDFTTCRKGFFLVNRTMQSVSAPCVFAGGDCVTVKGFPENFPPKTGAHALRQGPVIATNLVSIAKHILAKTPLSLMLYEPQSDILMLLNMGDGRGIVTKHGMTFTGNWVFLLKDHINKKLIRKFSAKTLLGEQGLQVYQEHAHIEAMRPLIYQQARGEGDDYSTIDWYDYTRQSKDIDKEVRSLPPQLALNLLLESSDTTKRGSCAEFEFQFSIFKRTDKDMEFRSGLTRKYRDTLETFIRENRPFFTG